MKKIQALISKEWAEVFKNRLVAFTVAFLPLLMTAIPLVILYLSNAEDEFQDAAASDLPAQFTILCGGLSTPECVQYFVVAEFLLLYLIIPVILPMTIASYSIVGEKSTRTLEPLLATPVTTLELLMGKGLAAVIPAVLATWGGFFIFYIGVWMMDVSERVAGKLFGPLWLLAVFLVGPLLALAGVSIAVMISSRVNDPRVAEQIAGIFVLPIILLMLGQTTGLLLIDERFILWMAGVLVCLDAVLLAFAVRIFQRETILTRWK
ncbi:MAG: ABC transporter permease subunit [Anaerolineales bacterium]